MKDKKPIPCRWCHTPPKMDNNGFAGFWCRCPTNKCEPQGPMRDSPEAAAIAWNELMCTDQQAPAAANTNAVKRIKITNLGLSFKAWNDEHQRTVFDMTICVADESELGPHNLNFHVGPKTKQTLYLSVKDPRTLHCPGCTCSATHERKLDL